MAPLGTLSGLNGLASFIDRTSVETAFFKIFHCARPTAYSLHDNVVDEIGKLSQRLKSDPKPGTREFDQFITVMSFYREAELHRARLLLVMHCHLRDPDSEMSMEQDHG